MDEQKWEIEEKNLPLGRLGSIVNPPMDSNVASFSAVAAASYWLLRAVPRATSGTSHGNSSSDQITSN